MYSSYTFLDDRAIATWKCIYKLNYELTNILWIFGPFSFMIKTLHPDFKVVLCHWIEARLVCENNACCRRIYIQLTTVSFPSTSSRFKTNVIRHHISISDHVLWFVPVQGQGRYVRVKSWHQILNLPWNQSCRDDTILCVCITWLKVTRGNSEYRINSEYLHFLWAEKKHYKIKLGTHNLLLLLYLYTKSWRLKFFFLELPTFKWISCMNFNFS